MRRYVTVGLGLLLGLGAACVGDNAGIAATTQPAGAAGAWSTPVAGLMARVVLARSHVFNGTPMISTRLDLRNISSPGRPLTLPASRKLTFRVVDAAGRELPRAMGDYDGLSLDPKDLSLPSGDELSEDLTRSGLGVRSDQVALIDLGSSDNWVIPRDGKEYFLQVTLDVPGQPVIRANPLDHTWHGRIILPPARVPLQAEPMDPATLGQRIDELGRAMFDRSARASRQAMQALSLIDDQRVIPWYVKALKTNPNECDSYGLKVEALDRLSRFNTDEALAGLRIGMVTRGTDMGNCNTPALAEQSAGEVRHCAAIALARSPHPQAKALLWSMWNDPARSVRLTVVQTAARMGTEESGTLVEKMTADPDPVVRNEAIRLKARASASAPASQPAL